MLWKVSSFPWHRQLAWVQILYHWIWICAANGPSWIAFGLFCHASRSASSSYFDQECWSPSDNQSQWSASSLRYLDALDDHHCAQLGRNKVLENWKTTKILFWTTAATLFSFCRSFSLPIAGICGFIENVIGIDPFPIKHDANMQPEYLFQVYHSVLSWCLKTWRWHMDTYTPCASYTRMNAFGLRMIIGTLASEWFHFWNVSCTGPGVYVEWEYIPCSVCRDNKSSYRKVQLRIS